MIKSYDELELFISDRLSKLRKQEDISARELSLSLGLTESYINQVENGRLMPSMEVLYYICEKFGISLKDFFDDNTEEPVLIGRIVKEIKKLDAKSLEKLLEFIQTIN